MARVTRSSVLRWLTDVLGIQHGADEAPNYTSNQIVPVVDINPKITTIARANSSTDTNAITLYTTPTDKDFFLTYCVLSLTKTAASDNVLSYIRIQQDGANRVINVIVTQTTTAGSHQSTISFPYPIRCDRNTAIEMLGSMGAGAMTKYGTIGGFILE